MPPTRSSKKGPSGASSKKKKTVTKASSPSNATAAKDTQEPVQDPFDGACQVQPKQMGPTPRLRASVKNIACVGISLSKSLLNPSVSRRRNSYGMRTFFS